MIVSFQILVSYSPMKKLMEETGSDIFKPLEGLLMAEEASLAFRISSKGLKTTSGLFPVAFLGILKEGRKW